MNSESEKAPSESCSMLLLQLDWLYCTGRRDTFYYNIAVANLTMEHLRCGWIIWTNSPSISVKIQGRTCTYYPFRRPMPAMTSVIVEQIAHQYHWKESRQMAVIDSGKTKANGSSNAGYVIFEIAFEVAPCTTSWGLRIGVYARLCPIFGWCIWTQFREWIVPVRRLMALPRCAKMVSYKKRRFSCGSVSNPCHLNHCTQTTFSNRTPLIIARICGPAYTP